MITASLIKGQIWSQSKLHISDLHSEMKQHRHTSSEVVDQVAATDWNSQNQSLNINSSPLAHPYLQMDIAVFELSLSNQGSFDRSKLRAFGDTPFGEDSSQKPVYVEHQGEAGSCLGQHRPVWDRMQRSMFWTHRGMCIIALFTPYNTKSERTWLSHRHAPAQKRQPYHSEHLRLRYRNIHSNSLPVF